jgi:peptidyl-prolyl cis-trans isomerase C
MRTITFRGPVVRVTVAVALAGLLGCNGGKDSAGSGDKAAAAADKAAEKSSGTATGEQKAAAKGEPVATVNGVAISRTDFDEKYTKMTRAFTTRNKDVPENLAARYKQSILNQLVEKELLRQRIEKDGIQIAADELAGEYEEYKKMFRTEENFRRYLKSSQVSEDQIKDNVRHNLAVNMLLEKSGDVAVAEDEAKEYYEKHKERYAEKEQVQASHILFKAGAKDGPDADKAAKKKADEIYGLAKKKDADFGALAKKHSQGPTSSRGGDLGFFTRGRMVKEFEEVAFKLKPGQVSKPVKTQFGWHVIKVVKRKEARQKGFDEVKESITKNLKARKNRRAKQALLKDLRAEAKVETLIEIPKPSVTRLDKKPELKVHSIGDKKPAAEAQPAAEPAANAADGSGKAQ